MQIRDAIEDDAEPIGVLTETSTEAAHRLIRERTVRVAEADEVAGVVAFDATTDEVLITQLCGEQRAQTQLLEEPVNFARGESMAVEIVVADAALDTQRVVDTSGFSEVGSGPRFEGATTTRYRMEP